MAKPSNSEAASSSSATAERFWISNLNDFFLRNGILGNLPESSPDLDALVRGSLRVDRIDRGRIICSFTIKKPVTNKYSTLHGGVVATVAEVVALACVRSVAGDKDFFLGESSISYLSAARLNAQVEVDGCVLRHGRTVVVTSVEFRVKETRKLVYVARATFYNMPSAKL
eukprot:TRINITY_DN19945_c0_g1_i2.p1 TRINITY_DN19945_c0_g1~~TRINITY_DN19945_c0_g1_i2.p1  ORF type:complete len:170 (+),score=15.57 TRINITY_DN19945_c0_g1_i2:36-545(+)